MDLGYWQYFIALEADLAETTRFVEPSQSNMNTYSIEFARLILSAGSEIDVLCKVLCNQHGLHIPAKPNIDNYRTAISSKFPNFTKLEVLIPRYSMSFLPWQKWDSGTNPDWWGTHNDVKHTRHSSFEKATLSNALNTVSGLFVLVSYIYHEELRAKTASPWPQLLTLNPTLNSTISTDRRPGWILPDFRIE